VVAAAVAAAVVTVLTGLGLPEAALASGLVAVVVALAPKFLWLPLGAELTADRPLLVAGLGGGWLAAAGAGPVAATRFGPGLVSNATLVAAAAGAYLLGLTLAGLAAGSVPTYRRLRSPDSRRVPASRRPRASWRGT